MQGNSPPNPRDFQDQFFQQNPGVREVFRLYEYLPSVLFFAKDAEHRYIGVNSRTLHDVFGMQSDTELLGRTDLEFQPPALAEAYHAEDRRVMEGGKIIANQVWLVPHVGGTPKWYVSTKTPLFDPEGNAIGIAGAMYPVATKDEQLTFFQELWPVIQHMDKHYNEPISMAEMAKKANLSTTHFNARFRAILRLSPTEYVLSRRVQHAQRLLTQTEMSIVDIGAEVGFFDQSHFTKRFRRVTGLTPRGYRKRFR
ncbi:Exoenzyme S synthesis regulatory protein ExsA [Rubripirellula amarantea]|uniref:Exoenzyme S synthesis regulatory protein ExsA n=1 Tax=Rubripirellula amarantea TaxID=2527999 RepID=A0A5C5WEM3_9BACT|nr:AraC family transcriptional regulator [Rubripirellula amarantea]TWT49376.1 Exoenzyme S synthesis regulatory protein ExsA [Rubripirellula amarantea]